MVQGYLERLKMSNLFTHLAYIATPPPNLKIMQHCLVIARFWTRDFGPRDFGREILGTRFWTRDFCYARFLTTRDFGREILAARFWARDFGREIKSGYPPKPVCTHYFGKRFWKGHLQTFPTKPQPTQDQLGHFF